MSDVRDWLDRQGLGRYAELFAAHEIELGDLGELTDEDLRELGLPLGPRKRLQKAIRTLGGEAAAPEVPAAGEGERRQLTVMFADLAGSTELSQRLDPEALGAIIRAFQQAATAAIERFGGYVARYMGDGVLAYFGYPRAHEDDAERAVHAGLALLEAVAGLDTDIELAVRVGIATGPVVVGELIGRGASQESAVVGETPNLAARLQGIAAPGSVLIAETTRRLIEGRFELEALAPRALKGLRDPVRAHRVTAVREASRFEAAGERGRTPLVGREEELGMLRRRWELAREGEGQVVMLGGESGVGKSRLAAALRERLRDEPHLVLRYQCSPYHLNTPFHPVIEQLERAAGFARGDDAETRLDKLEALLGDNLADPSRDAPLLAALLSLPVDRYPPLEVTPRKLKADTITMLTGWYAALSERAPILLLLEDAHWIDPSTLELFEAVVDAAQQASMLLLLTHRPDFEAPWHGHGHVTRHSLNSLGRRDCALILEQLAGERRLPEAVKAQILERTDGIPLFVEEFTRTVLESGLPGEGDDLRAAERSLPPHAVPSTLQDSLMARLDRLAPAKEAAQVGALLGRAFSYELLAALLPIGDDALRDALARLAGAGLVSRRGVPPQATYTFKHALVRDAAYNSLLLSRRQVLHARTAELLERLQPGTAATEPELVAHHYTEAGLPERALPYWQRAGERNSARSAYAEAVHHFRRGLALLGDDPAPGDPLRLALALQTGLADALVWSRGFAVPEVEAAYNGARALCRRVGDAPGLFGILWGLWHFYVIRGDLARSRELAGELQAHAEASGHPDPRAQAHRALGETLLWEGDFAAARAELERGAAVYDAAHATRVPGAEDAAVSNRVLLAIALWCLGCPDQALRAARAGLEAAEASAHVADRAMALAFMGWVHLLRREPEPARRWSEALLELATERGMVFFEQFATVHAGAARAAQGRPEAHARDIARALEVHAGLGAETARVWFDALLAQAWLRAGQPAEARAALDHALRLVATTRSRWWRGGAAPAGSGVRDAEAGSGRGRSRARAGPRRRPRAAGALAGAACGGGPRAAVARAGRDRAGARAAGAAARIAHRGLRHPGRHRGGAPARGASPGAGRGAAATGAGIHTGEGSRRRARGGSMSLSVIGAGFGRTGTMSLKMALETLGLGPCHHMEEVLSRPDQLAHWRAAAAGGHVDWEAVYAGYGSAVDWPTAHYWRELAAFYPEARVILTLRPPERWWQSFSGTIRRLLEMREEIPDPHVRGIVEMADAIITRQTFGGSLDDREAVLAAYARRTEEVQAALPAARVLVFDVAQGWAPLCTFLGCPVPEVPFPRSNSTDEFWELVRGGR